MLDGFYSVEFITHLGPGGGVALLKDGRLRGGDAAMYYSGTYDVHGDKFTANIQVFGHATYNGAVSALENFEGAPMTLRASVGKKRQLGTITGTIETADGTKSPSFLFRFIEP